MTTATQPGQEASRILPISANQEGRVALIDEYGQVCRQLDLVKALEKRQEFLRRTIAGWFADNAADQAFVAEGTKFIVEVGARATRRTIKNMAALQTRLGKAKFFRVVTVPMAELDRVLPADEQAEFVSLDRTGPRNVRLIQRFSESPSA